MRPDVEDRTRNLSARAIDGRLRGFEDAPVASEPVFLTGATGFVGMELLARYLERTDREVFALVRARDDAEADARLRETVESMLPDADRYAGRLVAVRGDVTQSNLGMSARRRAAVAGEVGEIVHAAASVSFSLPLPESRAINVEGTRRMLRFAELCSRRGGLRRFSYVSTAYVAGDRRGSFGEDDLDVGQSFRNSYEQSKFEAEQLVRAQMARLPIQVFRPSIVVGEQDSGWTPTFNVIYWPLRAFAKGAYSAIPARRRSPVDIVSIDYVADAIFELSRNELAAGETYNLAAGPRATSVGELLELTTAYFNKRAPTAIPPRPYRRLVHPLLKLRADERRRSVLEQSEVFFPYFAMRVNYDTTRATERLRPLRIEPAPLPTYFDRLLDYATAVRWKSRPYPGATTVTNGFSKLRPYCSPAVPSR
jgi:thioester reductase-like protein